MTEDAVTGDDNVQDELVRREFFDASGQPASSVP